MKKLVLLLISLFVVFYSCDEAADLFGLDKDDDTGTGDGIRLKKIIEYEPDGVTLKSQNEFFYTNEKLTQILEMEVNDEGVFEELQTRNFSYTSENKVEEELIWKGSTTTPFNYFLSGGHIVKIENKDLRNGKWLVEERWEYTYNGDLLVEYLGSYDNEDGSTSYYGKADYSYLNGMIFNEIHYMGGINNWYIWYQDSIFSSFDKIDSILRYNQEGNIIQKSFFYYNDTDLLETVEGFNVSQNTLQPLYSKQFSYNDENNLVHVEEARNNNTEVYKLEWENGQGNEELFWKMAHQIEPGMPVFP